MALISAALGGLGAPVWLWIAILAVGIVVGALAGLSWWAERGRNAADKGSVADSAATRPLTYADLAAIRVPVEPDAGPLADQIDSLIHEGMDLVNELSVPVQPEQTNGVWKVSGGDAPQEWIDTAVAFQQRCRDLLETQRPALLADFRDGHMKHFQMEREANERREQSPSADRRSDGEKMLALANQERSGPRREVEACLEGLSVARKAI